MEFVLRLEDAFEIQIPDEDLKPEVFGTIQTVTEYVRKRAGGSTPCDS